MGQGADDSNGMWRVNDSGCDRPLPNHRIFGGPSDRFQAASMNPDQSQISVLVASQHFRVGFLLGSKAAGQFALFHLADLREREAICVYDDTERHRFTIYIKSHNGMASHFRNWRKGL